MNFSPKPTAMAARALPVLALLLALGGCVVAPRYHEPYAADAEVVYAPAPPPPLQAEVVPLAPSPVHIWINGYWGWGGARYVWRPGHWAAPPRPGYVWHPHRWEQGPHGWRSYGGYWGRR